MLLHRDDQGAPQLPVAELKLPMLAGAGLGGCIMVLVRTEGAEEVRGLLEKAYYGPEGIEPQLFVCQPAWGSQVLTSIEART